MEARDLWIREFSAQLEEMLADFNDGFDIESNLTGLDRKRLTSARVRNNGFIGVLAKKRRKRNIAQRHKGTEVARGLKAARNLLS